ncbi:MAG TPA: DedA family protein [Spirochaetota bacterium]|nr:DedA family protein [Spirochaetota bacterium]
MLTSLIKSGIDLYMTNINYLTVGIFMCIESTFIPFPSELIVPPAAYKAAAGEMNIFLILIAATTGALCGSLINYTLAYFLGRKVIFTLADTKIAHLLLINSQKVEHAADYFLKYGKSSTFIGRLIPGIRHLISIPAGLAKMPLRDFMFYTFIGAGIWNIILAVMGYFLYTQKEVLEKYYTDISYAFLALGVIFIIYIIVKTFILKK